MTQDEIIEIAQMCKLIGMRPHLDGIYTESLVTFAKLVAAKALAQRTWVGLTDEEENEYNYLGPDMYWVIQEISAKLKEKNT